jgi:hypothetical protein
MMRCWGLTSASEVHSAFVLPVHAAVPGNLEGGGTMHDTVLSFFLPFDAHLILFRRFPCFSKHNAACPAHH